jgi:hypothetical protein
VAKNTGHGFRRGAVVNRTQVRNTRMSSWIKRNGSTGQFMDGKSDGTPFKGIRRES